MRLSPIASALFVACTTLPFAVTACDDDDDSASTSTIGDGDAAAPTTTATTTATATTTSTSTSTVEDAAAPDSSVSSLAGAAVFWKTLSAEKVSMDFYVDTKRSSAICPLLKVSQLPKNSRTLHFEIERTHTGGAATWTPGTFSFGKSTAANGDEIANDIKGAADLDATCQSTPIGKPSAGSVTFTQVSNESATVAGSVTLTFEGGATVSAAFVADACTKVGDNATSCEP